jgi:hypothetical protein
MNIKRKLDMFDELARNQQDLDPEIVDLVNDNFWNLVSVKDSEDDYGVYIKQDWQVIHNMRDYIETEEDKVVIKSNN